jgi:transposase
VKTDPPDDREVLSVEDWAEIRRLHRAEGMPIRAICRRLGVSRNTVRRALAAEGPPRYRRPARGSIVDAVEPQIRDLLRDRPDMPATVIAERIGWSRSLTVLKVRVRELRPLYTPPDPASRTAYEPGQIGQCDLWFPPVDVPLGAGQVGRPPVLVIVAGYSRVFAARMLPTRTSEDLLAGMWALLAGWGGAPRTLVWDNESAIGSWKAGRPQLTAAAQAFRGTLGIAIRLCRPADPEAKGLVERVNGYLETSFLPGRTFTSPADFNTQLGNWLPVAANRWHRRLQTRPADRWEADRTAMVALPPVAPTVGWHRLVRLPRDHYVRVDANDYSVHPAVVGRWVSVNADLERVGVSCAGRLVADHERCWARGQSFTDPIHARAAALLREQAATPRPRPSVEAEVAIRDLADYDRAAGVETAA